MRTAAVLAALALLLVLPAVQSHGAPSPRPQDTRLLHDHNDDCGGDGVTSNCRGSIDLITLDVQEFNDGADKVAFRFTLDKGQAGSHKLTLSFDSPSGKKTFETTTADQTSFSGGFDKLTVSSAGDGTRYILEAQTTSEKSGLTGSNKVSNFRVEARRDNTLGDFMPGGYQGAIGPVQDPPQGDGPTNYVKPDYQARGASYYVTVAAPNVSGTDGRGVASFEVRNLLDVAQTVTLRVASDSADASFAGDAERTIDLPRKGSQTVEVEVSGTGTGQFTITATTNLGGKTARDGSYDISGSSQVTDPVSENPTKGPDDSKGAPTIPLAMTGLALLIVASRRR